MTLLTIWSSAVLILFLVLQLLVLLVVSAYWSLAVVLTSWCDVDLKLAHPPYQLPLLCRQFSTPPTSTIVSHHSLKNLTANRLSSVPSSIYLTTPRLLEDVLVKQFDNFEREPYFHDLLLDVLGDGIFAVDVAAWIYQRKTAIHLFIVAALRGAVVTSVHKQLPVLLRILQSSANSGLSVGMTKLLNRFIIEAFAEIGFGVKLNGLDAHEDHPFQAAIEGTQRINFWRSIRPAWYWKLLRWLNLGLERQLKKDVQVTDAMAYRTISRSLASSAKIYASPEAPKAKPHPVSLFLDNARKGEAQADPVFIRDVVVNFLVAGRDTTAQALSWFFYCLSQHPEVELNIRKELASKLLKLFSGEIAAPTMDQVAQLVYLEATQKETLRLYPSVPLNMK